MHHSVAYLGFCEGGGRAKDARFEAPEAPMGWSVGRGCPLLTEEGVRGGAVPPPQKLKKIFWVQCVQKNFVFRPNGGGIATGTIYLKQLAVIYPISPKF